MNAEVASWGMGGRRGDLGMSLLAWLAAVSTALAVLVIWTLLSSPADVATAAAEGAPELVKLALTALYDGIVTLLSWL
jgi:hypothetical protein